MRTTIDIPEDLLRRVKAEAALRGMKLKDLVASLLADGLASRIEPRRALGHNRPPPVTISGAGRTIPALSNAEIEELLLPDDLERLRR